MISHPDTIELRDDVASHEQRLMMAHAPAEKLTVVLDMLREMSRTHPSYAVGLALEGYRLAEAARRPDALAAVLQYRGTGYHALGRLEHAAADLADAYTMFLDLGMAREAASAAIDAGGIAVAEGRHVEANEWYMRALEHVEEGMREHRCALHALGGLRADIGDYAAALRFYHTCRTGQEQAGDGAGLAATLAAMGALYARMDDRANARAYYEASLAAGREISGYTGEVDTLAGLAALELKEGNTATARELAFRTLALYDALGAGAGMARTFRVLAAIEEHEGAHDRMLEFAGRAFALADNAGDDTLRAAALVDIGRAQATRGVLDEARFVLEQALEFARTANEPGLTASAHEALTSLHERIGRPALALEHYRRFAALQREMAGAEKQRAIAELEIRYAVAEAEREREQFRLRALQLEELMEAKQNELASMAMVLVRKKEMIGTLRRELGKLRGTGMEIGSGAVEDMLSTIESDLNAQDEWTVFEGRLGTEHAAFMQRLLDRCPELTPTELKICSLARINLSTKEMAQILFTSVRTVHTHRHNIRRKLALESSAGLTAALAAL